MSSMTKGVGLGIVATLVVALIVWLTVAYTGAYNVAASEAHADAVRWTLETTMRNSVTSRAEDIDLPGTVPEDLVAEGAGHYADTCAHCHGAPGRDPADWSRGMRPEPPDLVEAAAEWTPAEIYWIVDNGIKMSGMPAFGPHRDPQELLAITAFVSQLPGLSAEDYAALTGGAGGQGGVAATPAE